MIGCHAEATRRERQKRVDLWNTLPSLVLPSDMYMDEEALYSVTSMDLADEICRLLVFKLGIPRDATITDAMACVGGNTWAFARYFKAVHAVEIDARRFTMLRQNMRRILSVNDFDKIEFYRADFLQKMQELHQTIVFLDLPWGGPSYKDQTSISLNLDGMDLSVLCRRLERRATHLVLKVPTNFAYAQFRRNLGSYWSIVYQETMCMARTFDNVCTWRPAFDLVVLGVVVPPTPPP